MGVVAAVEWWRRIKESEKWRDGIYYSLSDAYSLVCFFALIQLIRIHRRLPEDGWTKHKVFHLMNFIFHGVRAIVFGFHVQVFLLRPKVLSFMLLDLPGLLFFSMHTIVVLFWAEVYYQAKRNPSAKPKVPYVLGNFGVYIVQVCIWMYMGLNDNLAIKTIAKLFNAVVSLIAALGFLLYGGRLFLLLKPFSTDSVGRRKKVDEVGFVTSICFVSFLIRSLVEGLSAFEVRASLDVLEHPKFSFIYYIITEVVSSALVLYILRKLPPQRASGRSRLT